MERWIACPLINGTKTILLITIYRIPQGGEQGIYALLLQYNQRSDEIKTATSHQKEIFKSIISCT